MLHRSPLAGSMVAVAFGAALCGLARGAVSLYQSQQLTPAGEYTFNIEGPAVDAAGTLYVVNFARTGTIGKLQPGASRSELFATLPEGSIGNSIRFDSEGRMFVADWKRHNVFVIERGVPRVYFASVAFNQPNDLTVAADGTLYASDPHWRRRDGQVWRITRAGEVGQGEVMASPRRMGTTNGIDLSPDGRTLYVGESETREIWAYRIEGARLTSPRLVKRFNDFSFDGLRTDIDGRLYVARILKGTIAVLAPPKSDVSDSGQFNAERGNTHVQEGRLEREIPLRGPEPTNLAFGGADGRTVFVTQRKGGFIETFQVGRPGREFCLQKPERCGQP